MGIPILPNAILLEIFLLSDVATLGNLRVVSQSFYSLIEAYGNSIASAILSRSYAPEIVSCFSIATQEDEPVKGIYDINRRVCKARQMAALRLRGVDCWDRPQNDMHLDPDGRPALCIPLETMFEFLTLGLGVLWNLSAIARKTIRKSQLNHKFPTNGVKTFNLTRGLRADTVAQIENQIWKAQISYLQSLSITEQQSLHYTYLHCVEILYRNRYFKIPHSVISLKRHEEREKWIIWLILREGPDFIARRWFSIEEIERCTDAIMSELATRTRTQLIIEKGHGRNFYQYICYWLPRYRFGDYQLTVDLDMLYIIADGFGREVIAKWSEYEEHQTWRLKLSRFQLGQLPR